MQLSLQGKFLLFLVLPVGLISLFTAVYGFVYARESLIQQWIGKANAILDSATREISCQLEERLQVIDAIREAETVPHGKLMQVFLAQRLLAMEGVRRVDIDSVESEWTDPRRADVRPAVGSLAGERSKRSTETTGETVVLDLQVNTDYDFLDILNVYHVIGQTAYKQITVSVDFGSLIGAIKKLELWAGTEALLATSDGRCLASTEPKWLNRKLGDSGHPLEKRILAEMEVRDAGTFFGKGRPPDLIMGFRRIPSTNWFLVLYSEGCEVCQPMLRFRLFFILGNIGSITVMLTVMLVFTRPVVASIKQISRATKEVEEGDYSARLPEAGTDEIGQLKRSFNKMREGLRQRDLIQQTFGRYVDKGIAEELMRSPDALALGGKEKTVTILMADLRGFTPVAERLEATEVITLLNRYLAAMIPIIERNRGIIVDFYGDGILAFFDGPEEDVPRRAAEAVQCAVRMQQELRRLSTENRSSGLPELAMGIGIHTGTTVVVGNVGSETRAKYGIVGSPVNFTQRLQSIAAGGKIVVSAQAYEQLADQISFGQRVEVCLKGVRRAPGISSRSSTRVMTARSDTDLRSKDEGMRGASGLFSVISYR